MIKWVNRFRNKTTLVALISATVAFGYQVAGAFGVVPSISEDALINLVGMGINVLTILGIVVDPNTPGIGDSEEVFLNGKD